MLFNPKLVGQDYFTGADYLVNNSINQCDIDLKKDLYSNIILSGSTTLIDNFSDRFKT